MARTDTPFQRNLRNACRYREVFDVGLLADFDSERAREKFDFYDQIGEAIRSLGKSVFLPHREVKKIWKPKKVYTVTNSIIVPSLDIALFYAGLSHADPGMMVAKATQERIPVICFYELKKSEEAATLTRPIATCIDTIIFENEARGIERLKAAVEEFYSNQA